MDRPLVPPVTRNERDAKAFEDGTYGKHIGGVITPSGKYESDRAAILAIYRCNQRPGISRLRKRAVTAAYQKHWLKKYCSNKISHFIRRMIRNGLVSKRPWADDL